MFLVLSFCFEFVVLCFGIQSLELVAEHINNTTREIVLS